MQKHVNLVDLVKGFPTNIYLQNLASIQKRTSPIKFAHLAEKSEKGSISNLSTKVMEKWNKSGWGQKLAIKAKKATLTDFERFRLMLAKKKKAGLVAKKIKK